METRRRQRQSTDAKPVKVDFKRHQEVLINPPHRASTLVDSSLVRVTQLIIIVGSLWLVYSIYALNTVIPSFTSSNIRGSNADNVKTNLHAAMDLQPAQEQITSIRNEFYDRYGGKDESLAMLKRGLKTFSKKSTSTTNDGVFAYESLRGTALRLLSVLIQHEQQQDDAHARAQFIFSFGGYSVTVGRGNHFSQSFPFVFQSITKPLLESIGIDLIIRNNAIGGIPSFPYGWCLPNFLGKDSHGISWDYGMNEGNGGMGLESYIRHGLSSMDISSPLFVMVDTKKTRMDVLQYYVEKGFLVDPLALGKGDAVTKELLNLPEEKRPKGLIGWNEWGAPFGAPGQSSWHPKKMEHELMGWMLAMYFAESVEVAVGIMESEVGWRDNVIHNEVHDDRKLPRPMLDASSTSDSSLLHGVQTDGSEGWGMPQVSCRTSFLPNVSGTMESIVVSGMIKDDEAMINPRNDALFDKGWVMDIGKVERETKAKVNKYGGLGYIDMKTALYGIPSSGILKLWLPYEGSGIVNSGNQAADYFKSVVLCEVNEKRGAKECNVLSDLQIVIDEVIVPKDQIHQVHGVASYLDKNICIQANVPTSANISSKDGSIGLDVEVQVINSDITRENGACSISHVIWQNK